MKNVFWVAILVVSTALTAGVAAGKFKIPSLKYVKAGAFNLQVIGQTPPELVQQQAGMTVLRKLYIAKWGVNRFEYGMVQYQCKGAKCEVLGDRVPLKTYTKCTGFRKNGAPHCTGLESARVDVNDPLEGDNRSQFRRTWYTCDDYDQPCKDRDEWAEYPNRYTPEDPEFNLPF